MNATKKLVLPFILIVGLVAGGVVLFSGDSDTDTANQDQQESQNQIEDAPAPEVEIEDDTQPADGVEAPVNIEEATLVAVNGYEGSGAATRSFGDAFIHEVIAQLGDPAEGKFYEGWLESGGEFISTGRLENEEEGVWSLVYSQSEDASNLSNVVITEETEANGLDNVPEAHVLEGSF